MTSYEPPSIDELERELEQLKASISEQQYADYSRQLISLRAEIEANQACRTRDEAGGLFIEDTRHTLEQRNISKSTLALIECGIRIRANRSNHELSEKDRLALRMLQEEAFAVLQAEMNDQLDEFERFVSAFSGAFCDR